MKKLKKLMKNPSAFFNDSKKPHVKAAGKILFFRTKDPDLINKSALSTLANKKPSEEKIKGQNLAAFGCLFSPNSTQAWNWYKENVSYEAEVFVIPSSDYYLDLYFFSAFSEKNRKTSFFPIWEYFEQNDDLLDINYKLRKNDLKAYHSLNAALKFICLRLKNKKFLINNDNSVLADALAVRLRDLGIQYELMSGVSDKEASFPDSLESYSSTDENAINEEIAITNTHHKESGVVRNLFGLSAEDNIVLFYGGLDSLPFKEDKRVSQEIDKVLSLCLNSIDQQTYLVLALHPKKHGYLSKETISALTKKYRKRIVYLYENDLIPALIAESNKIFAVSPLHRALIQGRLGEVLPESALTLANRINDAFLEERSPLQGIRLLEALRKREIGIIAVPDPLHNLPITTGRQKYLDTLLGTKQRVYGATDLATNLRSDIYIQWGAEPNEAKSRPEIIRSILNKQKIYLEDGFIRSIGLWTNVDEPTCSVVVDTDAIYYDATRASLLEKILNSDLELTEAEENRAINLIKLIHERKISKYNYAPHIILNLSSKKKILIVDQKKGDMSIKYGLADEQSYWNMLNHALAQGDVEIIIKQHPCAISGNPEEAHFTRESLGEIAKRKNVHLVAFDINPYSLIDAVDEIYVVTSGMGFEALLAGKEVHCFGGAFYSNWGITKDHITINRRQKRRSLQDIFYIFYILLSFYINPETNERCEIEDLIDYIVRNRSPEL